MFRIVQFANTLTTSYWYVSGAHYKIQDVSICKSPQHLPTLSGIFTNAFTSTTSSLSFSCNSRSDNETYEIMAAPTLQQDLICHSFNENWKKPLKFSIKAKRCSKNWKNLNAFKRKWAYTIPTAEWVMKGLILISPVSSPVSMLSYRGEFNKELETRQMLLI